MLEKDIQVTERTTPYRGYMRIDVYRLRHRDFDHGWSIELSREVLERGNAVGVLPYDPERDVVVLIEQFRIGAYTAPEMSPWQIECIAGMIEPYQLAEDAAHRETREESGLRVRKLETIYHYLTSPGCTSESIQLFCGKVNSNGAEGVHGLKDEGEYIRVFTETADDAFALLDQGRIENGMTIIALQWLKINRDRLREKWLDLDDGD